MNVQVHSDSYYFLTRSYRLTVLVITTTVATPRQETDKTELETTFTRHPLTPASVLHQCLAAWTFPDRWNVVVMINGYLLTRPQDFLGHLRTLRGDALHVPTELRHCGVSPRVKTFPAELRLVGVRLTAVEASDSVILFAFSRGETFTERAFLDAAVFL